MCSCVAHIYLGIIFILTASKYGENGEKAISAVLIIHVFPRF